MRNPGQGLFPHKITELGEGDFEVLWSDDEPAAAASMETQADIRARFERLKRAVRDKRHGVPSISELAARVAG